MVMLNHAQNLLFARIPSPPFNLAESSFLNWVVLE